MIKRKVKKYGGSLIVVLGKFECEEKKIEEGDEVEFEIKEVTKCKEKKSGT